MKELRGKQWYYRGSLKSCNYACEYCPFSKKPTSTAETERDEEQLVRFVDTLCGMSGQTCAVQIVPYGEALIHEYYWREMARLSRQGHIELVGAQTNVSFPVEDMLAVYVENGGDIGKLRLWCTFHPTMTTGEAFVRQCHSLLEKGVCLCVGVVAAPERLEDIRWLRENLPADVYLWLNRFDGMQRAYGEEEILAFLEIDPFFFLELKHPGTDVSDCRYSVFVEGDGNCKRCNIDSGSLGNLYDGAAPVWTEAACHFRGDDMAVSEVPASTQADVSCHRKNCSCYLAYCNRSLEGLYVFGKYPAFRIPSFPEAFFLDVDGTLVPDGMHRVPEHTQAVLRGLRRFSRLFLATSLPWIEANVKTRDIATLLSGGVYAGGGHCVIHGGAIPGVAGTDTIFALQDDGGRAQAERLRRRQKAGHYRVHVYEKRGEIYKITLVFSGKGLKEMQTRAERDGGDFCRNVKAGFGIAPENNVLYEDGCLQILAPGVSKCSGVKYICREAGFAREDVAAYGDGETDAEMMAYYNMPRPLYRRSGM